MSEYDSQLHSMVLKGSNYREDFEYERFGEESRVQLRPLEDDEYTPLMAALAEIMGVEAEDAEEIMDEAEDEVSEARGAEEIDISKLDEDFINVVQTAATLGITASYNEDGEKVAVDNEEARRLVDKMVGGLSIEIGMDSMNLSGDVSEAEKFR